MKFRLPAALYLSAAILLGACDSGSTSQTAPSPTTAPTTAALPTTAAPQTTPTTEAAAPSPTIAAAATSAPANTPAVTSEKEQLTLNPVQVETTDATRKGALSDERTINLPPGFHIRVFAAGLGDVRWLGLSPEGVVYATIKDDGKVLVLPDADKDGVADEAIEFASGLRGVQGIAFREGAVYVATEGDIIRLEDADKDGKAEKRDVLASDLPTGGGHSTRTIAFGTDGKLYVSAGSSCNVCDEGDPKRAAISRYSADGKFEKVYAKGLRNAVGMVVHPTTGELWATNNGRDSLGDDIPPESIYNVKEDVDYGWPFCYGDRVPDESQNPPSGFCERTGLPAVNIQAHSAPLGLAFYTGEQFPAQFRGDMFVAFHGSWNRSVPTGYKLVRVRMKDNQADTASGDLLVEDFATGWLADGVWGRPVNPMVAPNGDLLLTDDKAGAIYSIYYKENAGP